MADPTKPLEQKPPAPAPIQRDPAVTQAYAKMREQAVQRADTQGQQASEQLKRNFARMGGLNSGSFVKQQTQLQEGVASQKQNAVQGIDAAEAQSLEQLAEQEKARAFQSSEAEKGRQFAGTEAEKGRSFQEKMTDKDLGFKRELFNFDKESKLRQLDLADKEFSRDSTTLDFNKKMAAIQIGLNVEDIMLDDGPLQRRFRAAERQRSAGYMDIGAKDLAPEQAAKQITQRNAEEEAMNDLVRRSLPRISYG